MAEELVETVVGFAEPFLSEVVLNFEQFDEDKQDDMEEQCHQLLQCVILVDSVHPCEQAIGNIRDLLHEMTKVKEGRYRSVRRGRPRVGICGQQLEFLVENHFRTKDIALIFGCSPRTIERRKAELHIASESYSSIPDTELDSLLKSSPIYIHTVMRKCCRVGYKAEVYVYKDKGYEIPFIV